MMKFILIVGVIIGGAIMLLRIGPAKSRLKLSENPDRFPLVSGYNLNRKEIEFPSDFDADLNLLIVPFKQHQQLDVNTWIPFAQQTEAERSEFMYYELPTISAMPALSRTFINEGMRAGIPDPVARRRTITLYIDKEKFKSSLGIQDEDRIYLFLVDRQGEILWQTSGEFSEDKAHSLSAVLGEFSTKAVPEN